MNITWNDLAAVYPEFVQWIVQKYGPLPEGSIKEEDYHQYKEEYDKLITR